MKKTVLVIGSAVAGATLADLFDPDRGRARRAQLSAQAKSRIRDATEIREVEGFHSIEDDLHATVVAD